VVLVPTDNGKNATLIAIDYVAGGNGPLFLRSALSLLPAILGWRRS
jgi:hypothetical protein